MYGEGASSLDQGKGSLEGDCEGVRKGCRIGLLGVD